MEDSTSENSQTRPAVYSKVLRGDVAVVREGTERWRRSGGESDKLDSGHGDSVADEKSPP
jgi:hypothetical protein